MLSANFHDLVLSPGDLTAATREPNLIYTSTALSSFQTLGVAPLTLLASAGEVTAVSKRPFLLSAPISAFGFPLLC